MLTLTTKPAVFPWRAYLSLASGLAALALSPLALAWLDHVALMGPAALALPILCAVTSPLALGAGMWARQAETRARGIAALGMLFGVIGLMLMSCSLMMQLMMGML